jgi:hypothetical protein
MNGAYFHLVEYHPETVNLDSIYDPEHQVSNPPGNADHLSEPAGCLKPVPPCVSLFCAHVHKTPPHCSTRFVLHSVTGCATLDIFFLLGTDGSQRASLARMGCLSFLF